MFRLMISTDEIRLYPGAAPGSDGAGRTEETFTTPEGQPRIRNVVTPTLTPVLPAPGTANGTAVIVAPGGGFFMLSWDHEGTDVAAWLAGRGVTCFVLKYRLADTGPSLATFQDAATRALAVAAQDPNLLPGAEAASADGALAVQLVRERAAEWGIRPDRIGLLGFSAGGFIATAVVLRAGAESRPDFIAPIYGGSATSPVPADAPPMFVMVAADDPLCYRTCMELFQAWRGAGRPAELHVYAQGGHGFGVTKRGLPVDSWLDRLADWMQSLDLV